jgi:hypothetical protein
LSDPIIIQGPEQGLVRPDLPDFGLPPAVGVQNFCVFRASRDEVELSDGRGWTYHHHVDMACWKGRLYVGWNSCERDEDVWPSRELYSTSIDGAAWSEPREMFPQGISTPLRMYFYRSREDRMLVIAGLRAGTAILDEDTKGSLVVRELRADHTLGNVFTLQLFGHVESHPTTYEQSKDAGFIAACRQLLDDRIFLEQQDRGRLLTVDRRMKWHDAGEWPGGVLAGDNAKWVVGKAFSFFRRRDGAWVGVSKMGWTTISHDDGETWSQPTVPPTLVTGKAKVWAQRTADERYALVYNPSTRTRYPLVIVSGEDGVHFSDIRIVHGELPIQRCAGRDRSIGPQYVRGISDWANDGSRGDDERAMWVVYSMSKEDIWVSRIPLPVNADESAAVVSGDFGLNGPIVPGWNTYQPKWASVAVEDGALTLSNRDPYDYAAATRIFRESTRVTVSFELNADSVGKGRIEIDVVGNFGSPRPVRLVLHGDGALVAVDGSHTVDIGHYKLGQWLALRIDADTVRGAFSVTIDDRSVLAHAAFAEPSPSLHRITFRTGPFRGVGGAKPVSAGSDHPIGQPARCWVRSVRIVSQTT